MTQPPRLIIPGQPDLVIARPIQSTPPLPEELKEAGGTFIRTVAERANRDTGRQLYPNPEHLVLTALELEAGRIVLHIGRRDPAGGTAILPAVGS
jgi:hypothetical protein